MPQMNKGGKFIFGWSEIKKDLSVHLPKMVIEEYTIVDEKKVFLISGSKKTGGFCVTNKNLLINSKISNILEDNEELKEYRLREGEFVKYKGRLYCWLTISKDGILRLNEEILNILSLKVGDKLLSIRSSDIAFTMGVKGPLIERAHQFEGEILVY